MLYHKKGCQRLSISISHKFYHQKADTIINMKSIIKYIKPYFETKKTHPISPASQQAQQQYLLLTYRSGIIQLLDTTYYTSDSGWGCMLRVGQMFVANIYFNLQGRNWLNVIKLFYDNANEAPFSIQKFTEYASLMYKSKAKQEWFSPCQCGYLIKELLENMDDNYRVNIMNDNCLFLSEVQTDRKNIIILLMCRIGLDEPEPQYRECVLRFFKFKHFNSVLGGTPKRAHLFLKHLQGYLGFLDPHKTQKVPPYEQLADCKNQFTSKLLWIKQKEIDSSMAIAFIVPQEEVEIFWGEMESLKEELGSKFFIYLAKEKPAYEDDDGIIEINDDF